MLIRHREVPAQVVGLDLDPAWREVVNGGDVKQLGSLPQGIVRRESGPEPSNVRGGQTVQRRLRGRACISRLTTRTTASTSAAA